MLHNGIYYCYAAMDGSVLRCEEGDFLYYSPNAKLMTTLVDMLYYGEAAQAYFWYNTENLPTDLLNDVRKAMATGDLAVLCNAIMKFTTGAYGYFHPDEA